MKKINFEDEYYKLRMELVELNEDLYCLIDEIDEQYGCVIPEVYLIDKFRHNRIYKLISYDIEEDEHEPDPCGEYSEELPQWVIDEDKKKFNILRRLRCGD